MRYLEDERTGDEASIIDLTIAMILAITAMGLALSYFAVDRPARRRRLHAARQQEFGETLQLADTEPEAYGLLARQLARTVGEGGKAVVLNRNNSADRLEAATPLSEDSKLAPRLAGATPRACLAVRKGGAHEQGRGRVVASVAQAAPVLANLRNLRIAERRAATDGLTGLANNRATQDNLKRHIAIAARIRHPLSVILLDLDHFKSINDSFGHGVGDDVLSAVGTVLTSNVRASDFVGRYGGEEYVVVLPETDLEGATTVAEKVRQALTMLHVPSYTGRISASFGVAGYPDHGAESDLLLAAADEALYRAKHDGRNTVRQAQPRSEPTLPGEGVRPEAVQDLEIG